VALATEAAPGPLARALTVDTVTEEELLDVLRRLSGDPTFDLASGPVRLTGGFWAELVAFRLAGEDRDLVARFMPDPATAAKESCIQRAVADLGFETPAVRWSGGPEIGDGRAVMVMDRVGGRPLLADLDGPAALRRLPSLARTIPTVLGRTMADLHAIDAEKVRARLHDADVGARSPADLAAHLAELATMSGRDDLVSGARWLLEHPPAPGEEVVCHGDLHPFNVLVDDGGAAVVLDWSASILAPREYDVAFTELLLGNPPLAVPRPARPIVAAAGRWLARRFRRHYTAGSGAALDGESLRWHTTLVCLRCLVEVAGWVAAGRVDAHAGHPWLTLGPALAGRLSATVGTPVRSR
jgi:aminoglycoside phosphotransferase (APT) family kinase protein